MISKRQVIIGLLLSAFALLTSCKTTMYGVDGLLEDSPTHWYTLGKEDPTLETASTSDSWFLYKVPTQDVSNIQKTGNYWKLGGKSERVYSYEVPTSKVQGFIDARSPWTKKRP